MTSNPLTEADLQLRKKFQIATLAPGLMDWIKPRAWALGRWIELLLMEKRTWRPMAWRERFKAWRHGFTSLTWVACELEGKDLEVYLTDNALVRHANVLNGDYSYAIYSKVNFSAILERLDAPQPPVLGHLMRGKLYTHGQARTDGHKKIFELLDQGERLVFRPSFGGGGVGILFLQQQKEQSPDSFLINNIAANREEVNRVLAPLNDYLITGFVEQADYAKRIFPGSTNTLRILTLWDFDLDEPFIAATAHRFGRKGEGMLDNFHWGTGGLSAPIDLETGELGTGVMLWEGEFQRLDHHPESGAVIKGVVVPGWRTVVDELLILAGKLPYAHCMGWDLVQMEDGWVCLEANPAPGYLVWQVHSPVLTDPRARKFYQRHGMAP